MLGHYELTERKQNVNEDILMKTSVCITGSGLLKVFTRQLFLRSFDTCSLSLTMGSVIIKKIQPMLITTHVRFRRTKMCNYPGW